MLYVLFVVASAMQVHRKLASSGNGGAVVGEVYETVVLDSAGFAGTEAEAASAFFQRLDEQLNKVNQFYERKEREFLERGESLRRQLQILVELKAAVTEARQRGGLSAAGSADPEDPSVSCSIMHGECTHIHACLFLYMLVN
jgi:ATP-dependent protease HslVU (ClpYQ) peptidase subunit